MSTIVWNFVKLILIIYQAFEQN
jgi:hypothetical protein